MSAATFKPARLHPETIGLIGNSSAFPLDMLTREQAAKAADEILARHREHRKRVLDARAPYICPVYRSRALGALRPSEQAEVVRRARSAVRRQSWPLNVVIALVAMLALFAWYVVARPSAGAFDLVALVLVAVERGQFSWRMRSRIATLLARG
jgi:hypothetical protein